MKKPAVDHRAAADACADRQIDDVADAPPRAIAPLAKRCGDPVILDPCGKSGSFRKCLRDGQSVPARQCRYPRHHRGFSVYRSGKRQADAGDRLAVVFCRHLFDQGVNLVHHAGRTAPDIGWKGGALVQPVVPEKGNANLRAADVDGDDGVRRHVRPGPFANGPRPCGRQGPRRRRQAIP